MWSLMKFVYTHVPHCFIYIQNLYTSSYSTFGIKIVINLWICQGEQNSMSAGVMVSKTDGEYLKHTVWWGY